MNPTYVIVQDTETKRHIICRQSDGACYVMTSFMFEHRQDAVRAAAGLQQQEAAWPTGLPTRTVPETVIEASGLTVSPEPEDAASLGLPSCRYLAASVLDAKQALQVFRDLPWAKVIILPNGEYWSRRKVLATTEAKSQPA